MKISDELHILQLPLKFGDNESLMNLSLIVDKTHGLTLIDTGVPGQAELIEEALAAEGFSLDDVKRIVITHQDLDHIGSLQSLKQRIGATVYAHSVDTPYIDGTNRPIKMPSPERLEEMPDLKERLKSYRPTHIDIKVEDGDVIEEVAGVTVIFTPGHTPGHMSLYLPATKTLIAGDSLTATDGTLNPPGAQMTLDMTAAMISVAKMAELDVETIVCYHGGLVTEEANDQLKRVAQQKIEA